MSLFSRHSPSKKEPPAHPKHIAVIMDGNGRWATQQKKRRITGHKAGIQALQTLIQSCLSSRIPYLSAYTFSTENWKRPQSEITFLFNLLASAISQEEERLIQQDIRVQIIGNKPALPPSLQHKINHIEEKTKQCTTLHLNLMINYGSKHEIIEATKTLMKTHATTPDLITESIFSNALYTRTLPDPDIIIRTGGEKRLSNFMLWQASYSELFFLDTLWPQFSESDFYAVLNAYKEKQRRFGGL